MIFLNLVAFLCQHFFNYLRKSYPCRNKQLMEDFKVDLTSLLTLVTHFGKEKCRCVTIFPVQYGNLFLTKQYCGRIGSTLRILGGLDLIDKKALKAFLLTCQSKVISLLFIFSLISFLKQKFKIFLWMSHESIVL